MSKSSGSYQGYVCTYHFNDFMKFRRKKNFYLNYPYSSEFKPGTTQFEHPLGRLST